MGTREGKELEGSGEPSGSAQSAPPVSPADAVDDSADFVFFDEPVENAPPEKPKRRVKPEHLAAVEKVWKCYQTIFDRSTDEFTARRKEKGLARLRDALRMPEAHGGLDRAAQIMERALKEVAADPWQDRSEFCEWSKYIFSSTEQLEGWVNHWRKNLAAQQARTTTEEARRAEIASRNQELFRKTAEYETRHQAEEAAEREKAIAAGAEDRSPVYEHETDFPTLCIAPLATEAKR